MKKEQKMEAIHSDKFKKLVSDKIEALADIFGGQHTCECHDTHNYVDTGIFISDDHFVVVRDHTPDKGTNGTT